jgi:uncharacterized membrane protein YhaH (DUF805 family)
VPNVRTGARGSPLLWLFFAMKGRVSRHIYWLAYVLFVSVNGVVLGQLLGGEEASFSRLAEMGGPFVILATIYANVAVTVKRLHDVGYSGFLAVVMFVPLVNLVFTIWIGIVPGNAGPNAYGDMPDQVPA